MSEQVNPWKTHSRRQVYENPWIEVSEDQVTTPAGTPGIYGVVHFKHVAVSVVPVDEDGNVWLVGQYRYATGRYSWELPAGGGDPDLNPLEAAQRELKEETGIEAADWRLLMEMDISNSTTDQHAFVYIATGLSYGEASPDDTEELEVVRVPLSEAVAMCFDGRMHQSLSIAALLAYTTSLREV